MKIVTNKFRISVVLFFCSVFFTACYMGTAVPTDNVVTYINPNALYYGNSRYLYHPNSYYNPYRSFVNTNRFYINKEYRNYGFHGGAGHHGGRHH